MAGAMTLDEIIELAEKVAIARALLNTGSVSAAARHLGTTYIRIYRRMRHHELQDLKSSQLAAIVRSAEYPSVTSVPFKTARSFN